MSHHRHAAHHRHQHSKDGSHSIAAHEHGNPTEIAEYLTKLADAIRSGGVQIRVGERAVGLRLADHLTLDLQALSHEGETQQIGVLLGWESPEKKTPPPAPQLTISPLTLEGTASQTSAGNGEQSPHSSAGQPRPLPREADMTY